MLRRALGGIAAFAISSCFAFASQAQDIKLYAFSSGALTIGKGILQNRASDDATIQVPVGFFVIKHPKGNVLFDTGNNDKIITDPCYWGASFKALKPVNTPDVAIDTQLQKIGLKPDDIKYVVVSHMHLDHGGNVGKFPNSTIVVQKDEILNAFWPQPGTGGPYMIGDVMPLRSPNTDQPNAVKMVQLERRHGPVRRRHAGREALGRPYAGQPDDDGPAEEQGPHHPHRRQRLLPGERRKEPPAEYRPGLLARAGSSAPTSGSATRWRPRRRISSPRMIRMRSRR